MKPTLSEIQERAGLGNSVNTTKLLVDEQVNGNWRVINTITFSSRFGGVSDKLDLDKFENQLHVARDQAQGWKQNGPWPLAKFKIVQFEPQRDGTFEMINEETV